MKNSILASSVAILAIGATASLAETADALVKDRQGNALGTVSVADTASGQSHIIISITGLPEGVHAVHIHETGDCSAEDFTSAGGHLAGGKDHGVMAENGPHVGDLPNASVQTPGTVQVEYFSAVLTVAELLDEDGAAFVVHAGSDDYESQPSGDAGDRIACGEFAQGR